MFEISSSLVHITLASCFNSSILFLFYLWDARLWKNFVFWSPSFSHNALDLCFHIFSSLINSPFISHFNRFIASIVPPLIVLCSACLSCCCFSSKEGVILSKETQLHCFNFTWHSFILPSTWTNRLPGKFLLQAKSTTSLHLASSSHFCSNLHGFHYLIWIPFSRMIKGLWSEDHILSVQPLSQGTYLSNQWWRLHDLVFPILCYPTCPPIPCGFPSHKTQVFKLTFVKHIPKLPFVSLVWTFLLIFHLPS